MVKPTAYRQAVGFVMAELNLSLRRACSALGFARSSWSYKSRRPPQVELVKKLRALASKRPRWGYRMLHLMLRRDGQKVNHKRVYRLYRQERLSVRRRERKRMTSVARTLLPAATRPNERWAMDFVSDVTAQGRRFRILTVVDEFTRECLALVKALDAWAYQRGVKLQFIRPGKPVENGYVQSFKSKLRNECLNQHWFTDLLDALVSSRTGRSTSTRSVRTARWTG
jgi:putative transposase